MLCIIQGGSKVLRHMSELSFISGLACWSIINTQTWIEAGWQGEAGQGSLGPEDFDLELCLVL